MGKLKYKTVNTVFSPTEKIGSGQTKDSQVTEYFEDNDEDIKPEDIEDKVPVDNNNQTDVDRHIEEKEKVKADRNTEEFKNENMIWGWFQGV